MIYVLLRENYIHMVPIITDELKLYEMYIDMEICYHNRINSIYRQDLDFMTRNEAVNI